MSERILKALMQMFAIIARVDGINDNGRLIVQSFLKQQLNQELVDQYLAIFDDFLEAHHQVTKKKDGTAKRTSLNSVKVLKICTQINGELTQVQKVVVLLRLIEFINSNTEIAEQELEFVITVAETFNIEDDEFKRCMEFVRAGIDIIPDSSRLLVIDNKTTHNFKETKHIFAEGVTGQARVLWIPSVNMYALLYYGKSDILLNGQLLTQGKVFILTPGSSLRSSKVKPVYYSDILSAFMSDTSKAKVSFVVKNLEFKFKGGKLGLRDINFSEDSGKLIGIMGGSGAGKSTLLNVLNGMEIPSGGSVKINGINIHTEKEKIEGVIGHVSQDDLLIEELTVFQNLFYNAKLCFGNKTDTVINQMVTDVLTSIGLIETRDLKVGSPLEKTISGGQRKRLNIALELIREPSVLFVDEPTSGLSSRDSENIMDLLKELALKGKLVFVVIHQPSSDIFKMFDKLMILDVGGYPIYYGNPVDSVIYFKTVVNHVNSNESECIECGNVNPEQVFNIIESKVLDEYGNITRNRKVSPAEWNVHYKDKIEKTIEEVESITEIPESTFKIPNKFKQFKVFITRDVFSKLTNSQYISINLLEAPLLAFILAYFIKFVNLDLSNKTGYTYRENENIIIYMFMAVVVSLFIGLTVSAEEIIRDRKIQKRESFLNLSKGSYIWSKIIIMFSLSAIQAILFVLVGNYVLEIKEMIFPYWIVLFSSFCFANMLGLNISASFNSAVTIYILIPILIIPQLLFSGVMVKFDKLNPMITSQSVVPAVGDMMASRWAFEALAVKQFKDNKFNKRTYKYDKALSIATYKKDYWLNEMEKKVEFCGANYQKPESKQEVIDALKMIQNEIKKELKVPGNEKLKCGGLENLNLGAFSPTVANQINDFLANTLKTVYMNNFKRVTALKDKEIGSMNKDSASKVQYLKDKDDFENESLNDLVTNKNTLYRFLDLNGAFVQKIDPIYLDPVDSDMGRAQFFAPRKKLFGKYYDTYWVNISVIWGMSLLLAITLYFDALKKLISGLEILFGKLSRKKRR
ncbi:MAG: ATP-binding cassette domain-containing protein [Bacteroidetes bacterium]|nr:ATP-binding cassette domain-containing protein [Bacteroidota bacterium]